MSWQTAAPAAAQEEDDGEPQYAAGLVGEYASADGSCRRVDQLLSFVWHDRAPDPRVGEQFSATWRGRLFSIPPGQYRLRVYAAGSVKLTLGGKRLLEAASEEPRWMEAEPVELTYGYHPLVIEYRKTSADARIGLFWEGPKFSLEPVPARHLFHDPPADPGRRFEEGARLVRALRCAACHDLPGERPPLPAPDLTRLRGNLSPGWLVARLQESGADGVSAGRRMPHFAMSANDARAVTAWLFSASKPAPQPAPPPPRPNKKKGRAPTDDAGRELFHGTGCLACHRAGSLGSDGPLGGGDLSRVADKRSRDFFVRWLAEPASINAAHRMPVFTLTPLERHDLAAYLATLRGKKQVDSDLPAIGEQLRRRGRELVAQHGCGHCHKLPEESPPRPAASLAERRDWGASCLNAAEGKSVRPGYRLSAKAQFAIRAYVETMVDRNSREPALAGPQVLAERNCLACHARGLAPGIEPTLAGVVEADPKLAPLLPAMKPPALFGVGDKLHEAALRDAISTRHGPLRPWLKIRMPRFDLKPEEMDALVAYFVDTDRIAPRAAPEDPAHDAAAMAIAGSRLVTSSGFGCTSCHQIGEAMPGKAELKSRGPDLAMLGKRIRRPWYDRWMPNPARIVPRMEMPSLVSSIPGVLEDDLDAQLAAVWHVLNAPNFTPPKPNPVRVVRKLNVPGSDERAAVLTDVLEAGGEVFIKPLLVGLANRHNVLLDLKNNRLAGWWLGDTARQHTRGKSWYWEPGGSPLLEPGRGPSELALVRDGRIVEPELQGQFPTEFDVLEHTSRGVRAAYRLRFPAAGDRPAVTLHITQTIAPAAAGGSTGFRRTFDVEGLPAGETLRVIPDYLPGQTLVERDARGPCWTARRGSSELRVLSEHAARWNSPGKHLLLEAAPDGGPLRWEQTLLTRLPVDQFLAPTVELPQFKPLPLDVVPGYTAAQLPLPVDVMPVALAWRGDGTTLVGSLKGRVFLTRDRDGDGFEDALVQFSDELAAPYGLAAHGEAIDVLNKYALLRLYDDDGDGRADRTETVASGWGHTNDYHDWAVGLPRDGEGNYYMALPCQQDDRSPAAARYRGRALRLVPREPTDDDPRRYRLEVICAGLRFPMGLARNRDGALFATDNQGNYNPFNELNHLVEGRHYGFINKLEFRPGVRPPLTPPAVNLPHPWTRSVNGIAFLYSPPKRPSLFGPFEGHLVGCEYDTRRLVRISLERVGDTYQGAAYPFSAAEEGEPTFLGPICCGLSPGGQLYVGNIRDSGWGGGANIGNIVRLEPNGALPPGIAEVRATAQGFVIRFTAPVDRRRAADAANYAVSSYRRISTPAYGGEDQDRATAKIESVRVSPDGRQAELRLGKLRVGFVYELRLKPLTADGKTFFPAEAHYTLNRIPAAAR